MDYIPQSVRWLVPEETSPCDIFLHFRGQYAIAVPAGQPFSFPTLSKLAKAGYGHVYVKKSDQILWDAWASQRHPVIQVSAKATAAAEKSAEAKTLYGNKRAELQSYVQKVITAKVQGQANLSTSFQTGMDSLQRVIKSPMLDWYFQQFHEPPDLFYHNGRVAYASSIFCSLHGLAEDKTLDSLVFSALIHELEGDPAQSLKTVVSQATLASLEKGTRPVPQEVTSLILLHDELCSGQGFPNKRALAEIPVPVRVFTLFNHFEHYRLQATGTRRARYDRVKQLMLARKQDYDPNLFILFWDFWERHVELVG